MQAYTARHILPVTSPARRDGAIVVTDGRISRVGPRAEIEAGLPDGTPVHDLGAAIVLPGLVNAHTHLELSWLGEEPLPHGDYVVERGRIESSITSDDRRYTVVSVRTDVPAEETVTVRMKQDPKLRH